MYRKGHIGMTLLAFAPITYILVRQGSPLLALCVWFGIQAVEPLPDCDFHIPGLSHRGVSHSLLAALVVGCVLGGIGWVVSRYVLSTPLLLADLGTHSVTIDLLLVEYLFGIDALTISSGQFDVLSMFASGATTGSQRAVALFGFFVGVYGILTHLLCDMITYMGIQPLLPLSTWKPPSTSIKADSPIVNQGLFAGGIVAILGAVVLALGGMGG
jgi:membrane-bound metal-dependent hydrolase YbcI (DUF457 family)